MYVVDFLEGELVCVYIMLSYGVLIDFISFYYLDYIEVYLCKQWYWVLFICE